MDVLGASLGTFPLYKSTREVSAEEKNVVWRVKVLQKVTSLDLTVLKVGKSNLLDRSESCFAMFPEIKVM